MGIWHGSGIPVLLLLFHSLFCPSIQGRYYSSASIHCEFHAVTEPAWHVSLAFGGCAPRLRLQGDTTSRRTSGCTSGCCGQRVRRRAQCPTGEYFFNTFSLFDGKTARMHARSRAELEKIMVAALLCVKNGQLGHLGGQSCAEKHDLTELKTRHVCPQFGAGPGWESTRVPSS